jgi:UV DNA damage endonuclease
MDRPRLETVRLGLCCQFIEAPIRFRNTTATSLLRLSREARARKLSEICLANSASLLIALEFCAANGIGSFRVNSQILPAKTHPTAGYAVGDLPDAGAIEAQFRQCGEFAARHRIRTVFHPDQFVVLNSPKGNVVDSAIRELEYHAEVAAWISADVINIHGGGGYGDKTAALACFARNLDRLSESVRCRLTVENDDKVFAPADLLPLCRSAGVPLVYDVHHHRCLPDGMSIEQATAEAIATWNREPLFHISSPLNGWTGATPTRHQDYIDAADFPSCWLSLPITVEVEAKAKEKAVLRLKSELRHSNGNGQVA